MSKTTLPGLVQSVHLILCMILIAGVTPVLADDAFISNKKNISDINNNDFPNHFQPQSIELICPPDICKIPCSTDDNDIIEGFAWFAINASVNSTCNGPDPVISNNFDPNGFTEVDCNNNSFAIPNMKAYQNVTFTATDACDDVASCTVLVVLTDEEGPTIIGDPYLTIRECDDLIQQQYDDWIQDNITNAMTATDNCGEAIWTWTPASPNEGPWINGYAVTEVFFTATDECGNATTKEVHFKLKNNFPPTWVGDLDDIVVECVVSTNVFDTPEYIHGCGTTTLDFDDETIPGASANEFSIVRTWTVTDNCEGVNTISQTLIVNDVTAPEPPTDTPADMTVQCEAEIPSIESLTAIDNCNGSITVVPSVVIMPGTSPSNFTEIRTWTFDDGSGNITTVTQTITVDDSAPPVPPTPPVDITVACEIDIPILPTLIAIDNCNGNITGVPTITTIPGNCSDDFVMKITWTFSDVRGNSSTASQTITVHDDEAPVPPSPPIDVTVQCADDIPDPIDLTATNNCDADITVAPVDQMTPDNCPNNFTIVRTWTFTDDCGNSSAASQNITVNDDTAPIAPSAPMDLTVQCAGDIPTSIDLIATDNCDGMISATPTDAMTPGNCPNNFTIVRTWIFTDDCGNSSTLNQNIIVNDDTAPIAPAAPMEVTVQCADDIPVPIGLTATDNCSADITASPTAEIIPGTCPNRFTMIRTWTFTDECGNSSTVNQTINVNDSTPPVPPTAPVNITVQCPDDIPLPSDLTALDNCDGDITIAPTDLVLTGNCPNRLTVIRTWTFTDACGNSDAVSQRITVNDNTAPIAPPAPMEINIQCADEVPASTNLTALDNCDGEIIGTSSDEIIPGTCVNNFTVVRTWTFEDICGNRSTVSQNINVNDDTDPVPPSAPANLNIQCESEIPELTTLEAIDNCDGLISTMPTDVTTAGTCPNNFSIVRTWTFTDVCGNTAAVSQTINVNDETAPVATPPLDVAVQCGTDVPAPTDLVATDNCDGDLSASPTEEMIPGNCINNFTIVRRWSFADACGNNTMVSQTISVVDDGTPVGIAPQDVTVQCPSDIPAPQDLVATINCNGTITASPTDEITAGTCLNNFTVLRTWVFTDACGNSAEVSQTITVNDNTPPTPPTAPMDMTVQCLDDIPNPVDLVATDNCSDDITVSPTMVTTPGDCPNSFTVVRTWTFTDDCENSSSINQTITVNDDIAPIAPSAPLDMTLQCGSDIPDPVDLVATDNCSDDITASPTIETTPGNCPNSFTVVRTWTFTDDCENSSSVSQTITVNDDIAPVTPTAPMDLMVQCEDDIPSPEDLVASDACDGDITGVVTNLTTPGDCPNNFTLVRTWTFEDACGNTSSVSQTFMVNDDTNPIPPAAPDDLNVQCAGEVPNPMDLIASDNCDVTITASPVDVVTSGSCANNFSILRTWTFTDACGNSSSINQTININDDTAPVPPAAPANISVECESELPSPMDLVATDNCDVTITASPEDEITPGSCSNNFTILRTWTFTDICGNVSSVSQTIDVDDQTDPVWDQQAGDLDLAFDCGADVIISTTPTASDNCGEADIELVSDDTTNMTCANNYVRTLLYKAIDACGNEQGVLFPIEIIVNDEIAPTITFCTPGDTIPDLDFFPETILCGEPFNVSVIASDNCGEVTYTYTRTDMPGIIFNGDNINDDFPIGTTIVKFFAEDACRNIDSCEIELRVTDVTAPVITCQPFNLAPMPGETITLTPLQFLKSFDDCSPLTLTFTNGNPLEITYSCADVVNINPYVEFVDIDAVDSFGNPTNCTARVQVFNNFCPGAPLDLNGGSQSALAGVSSTVDGQFTENIEIHLSGGLETMIPTDEWGGFAFPQVNMNEDYTVTPYSNNDLLNGVNTMDLIMIAKHILLIDTLKNPYQLIAADVNNSGGISAFDMIVLSRAILLIEDEFTNNTSWRFVDEQFQFPNPEHPFNTTFPESITVENIEDVHLNMNFKAIKVGDVNNSAQVNGFTESSDTRSEETLTLTLEEELLEAGQEYVFEFKAKDFNQISGYQFTLNFDPAVLEFVYIEKLSEALQLSQERFGMTHLKEGIITTNWYDRFPKSIEDEEIIFSMKFKALANVPVSQIFRISSDKTKAEAYDETLKTMNVELKIGDENHLEATADRFKLHQNNPNPFSKETVISFEIPEDAPTVLTIMDLNGKILKEFNGPFQKGYNEVTLKRSDLPGNSIFFYQLQSGLYRGSKKMIMSRL